MLTSSSDYSGSEGLVEIYNDSNNSDFVSFIITSTGSTMFTDAGNVTNVTEHVQTAEELLLQRLGPRSQDLLSATFLLAVYGLIFISGTVGNICTCIVIIRNSYMQTTTNYYLFSLAVSDVFILLLGKCFSLSFT